MPPIFIISCRRPNCANFPYSVMFGTHFQLHIMILALETMRKVPWTISQPRDFFFWAEIIKSHVSPWKCFTTLWKLMKTIKTDEWAPNDFLLADKGLRGTRKRDWAEEQLHMILWPQDNPAWPNHGPVFSLLKMLSRLQLADVAGYFQQGAKWIGRTLTKPGLRGRGLWVASQLHQHEPWSEIKAECTKYEFSFQNFIISQFSLQRIDVGLRVTLHWTYSISAEWSTRQQ